MFQKIREGVASETKDARLFGEMEIDGAYVGGKIHPANLAMNRIDRQLARNQDGQHRVVAALRQCGAHTPVRSMSEANGLQIVASVVEKNSKLFADEASHWDALHASFDTSRINHSVAYSLNGIRTNHVERFFSRLRRMIDGQHQHVSVSNLNRYASEAAWKEDHRELANGALTHRALGLALSHSPSRYFSGYWHR